MARSKTCTLHLELEVPTPVVMPKINGRADKSWGKRPAETSESSHECSCALPEPPRFGAPGSQQEPGSAPVRCRRNALLLLPRHLGALCISILLPCALSSQGSPSPAQPKLLWLRWQCPPSPWGHGPQELGLVTLQCAVFTAWDSRPTHCAHLQEGLCLPSLLPPPLCLLHSLGLLQTSSLPSPRQGMCLVSCLCSILSLTEAALSLP